MLGAEEVERPPKVTVFAELMRGHVKVRAACLLLKVSNEVLERQPATPEEAVVHPSAPPEPTCVKEPVRGPDAVRVEVETVACKPFVPI